MKQIIQVFAADLRMNLKHWMGAYMIVVPMAILIILRFFIPSMESTKATIAVVNEGQYAVPVEMVELLDQYAKIKKYPDIKSMEQKLRATGSAEGLYWDAENDQYVSVLERSPKGNQAFSVAAQVVRNYYHKKGPNGDKSVVTFTAGVPQELSNRSMTSPVASTGGSIFFVFMIIISGFIIGLGVVDDKENGTDRAILVSPVTKTEYFVGKSIYPMILVLVYAIIALLILGLMQVDIVQVYTLVVLTIPLILFFGLLLGALANNENEAIGVGKLLSWVVMLAILGGTLLPDNWQWAVYWAPFYWLFDMMQAVFNQSSEWIDILWKSAIMLVETTVFFLLLRKKIIKGLS